MLHTYTSACSVNPLLVPLLLWSLVCIYISPTHLLYLFSLSVLPDSPCTPPLLPLSPPLCLNPASSHVLIHCPLPLCSITCVLSPQERQSEAASFLPPESHFLFRPICGQVNPSALEGCIVYISQYEGLERGYLQTLSEKMGAR